MYMHTTIFRLCQASATKFTLSRDYMYVLRLPAYVHTHTHIHTQVDGGDVTDEDVLAKLQGNDAHGTRVRYVWIDGFMCTYVRLCMNVLEQGIIRREPNRSRVFICVFTGQRFCMYICLYACMCARMHACVGTKK